jgi:hypothetical protein
MTTPTKGDVELLLIGLDSGSGLSLAGKAGRTTSVFEM